METDHEISLAHPIYLLKARIKQCKYVLERRTSNTCVWVPPNPNDNFQPNAVITRPQHAPSAFLQFMSQKFTAVLRYANSKFACTHNIHGEGRLEIA